MPRVQALLVIDTQVGLIEYSLPEGTDSGLRCNPSK